MSSTTTTNTKLSDATQTPPQNLQPLSPNEKKILEFLESFMAGNGFSPSFQEIRDHFGFASFNSVQRYLKQLQQKEYIFIPPGHQKRAIQLRIPAQALKMSLHNEFSNKIESNTAFINNNAVSTPIKVPDSDGPSRELLSLPMLGKVAAGRPLEALDHDEFVDVPPSMVRDARRSYTLTVSGQSMIDDGIFDGDVLIIQEQKNVSNGEICVAVIENEATVKRFYLHQGDRIARPMIELRPSNEDLDSMWFSPDQVEVRGVVVGLMRKF